MIGVTGSNLYAFSSIYAVFQFTCNVAIASGYFLYLDLPIQFNNLNNVPINAIIRYGTNVISTTTVVKNRII
jgi:hypothetical protein